MTKIYFCAGHGMNTAGKRTPDGEREWSFNNIVALAFEKQMKEYEKVTLVRTDDRTGKLDVSLKNRTDMANKAKADYYFSFHHNAYKGVWGSHTGVETYHHKNSTKGKALAKVIQKAVVKAYGLHDRGIKTSNLHITRETNMPAVLVEGGFMDSTIDIKKLRDKKVLQKAGKEVADAVAKHLGLKKKDKPKPSKPVGGKLYKVQIGAFKSKANADQLAFRAKARGLDQYIVKQDGLFKVQIGAYSSKKNADAQVSKAKKAGFDTFIVHE